jgi:cytochrome c biogenesis protein CcmG/thiol:disulfide interchange protein DsbE
MFMQYRLNTLGLCLGLTVLMSIGRLQAIGVGENAPNFKLPNVHNIDQWITLEDFTGKWVYVDFWASWCVPCKKSLPLFEKLYQQYKQQGFEVIAVSLDDEPKEAKDFVDKMQLNYKVLLDAKMATSKSFGVIGMPTSFLINPKGEVVWIHQGFKKGDFELIKMRVETALSSQMANK